MTTREEATRLADALEPLSAYGRVGTRDVDQAALQQVCAALREALAAPEPEPVALESVHLTRDTRGMCVVRVNGRIAIRDNGDIIDHMATLEWFAAPPAAPAEDHATPSGGQEAGPQEDRIEAAYWRFDARHKGYSQWKSAPMSERDAFKAEMRNALEAEKVRAEMRLVARGWLRPDTPAAPDHLHDIAEKVAPAAPQAELLTIDQEKALSAEAKTGPFQHTTPVVGNDVQSGETLRLSSKRHAGSTPPAAPAPDGMVMVPREPTAEMLEAAYAADKEYQQRMGVGDLVSVGPYDHYRAMIAAAPQAVPAPAVREPLTDEQIAQIASTPCAVVGSYVHTFARAIERAHGITGGRP